MFVVESKYNIIISHNCVRLFVPTENVITAGSGILFCFCRAPAIRSRLARVHACQARTRTHN